MAGLGWPQRLWFVRHAESLGNVANAEARKAQALRLTLEANDSSIALSERGVAQATAFGRWMGGLPAEERPTQLLISPYLRTRDTTRLLLEAAGLDALPVTVDERLRDREQGTLDRLTAAGFRDRYPDEAARRDYVGKFWFRPLGGESWADVALRLRAALLECRLTMPDERVLVVTHDVVILLARYVIERLTPEQAVEWSGQLRNCSLTAYSRHQNGDLALERFNDTAPLEELLAGTGSDG
ncbi:MAG TPA: histidine phosphatase family protein [Mycobacteriales bacterium]|nr:histidine phosphatase family protein [Mycobacteriales bacterium]